MKRLYLFAVGGTGVRVLKALVMQLAAGVKLNADELIPIIIDLDSSNGNLMETLRILKQYRKLNAIALKGNKDFQGFFHTKIGLPPGTKDFHYDLSSKDEKTTLAQYIDYDNMRDSEERHLVNLLYSRINLNNNLNVGFKGNPNIGSITVHKLVQYREFRDLCGQFTNNDQIMIVGSLFGGTGAAGIPTLLKLLRNPDNGLPQGQIRNNIPIGLCAILPYYRLLEGKGEMINSDTFMTKAKAALGYYDGVIEEYNAMYYISDPDSVRAYENNVGGQRQLNPAHYIECFSALAAFHFAKLEDADYQQENINGQLMRKAWFEYGLVNQFTTRINFKDLDEGNTPFANEMARFAYVYKFFEDGGYFDPKRTSKEPYWDRQWSKQQGELDKRYFTDQNRFFQKEFLNFLKEYANWLLEMKAGDPSFSPINIEVSSKEIGHFIEGSTLKSSMFFGSPLKFSMMDTFMSEITKKEWQKDSDEKTLNEAKSKDFKLLYLLDEGTRKLFLKNKLLTE